MAQELSNQRQLRTRNGWQIRLVSVAVWRSGGGSRQCEQRRVVVWREVAVQDGTRRRWVAPQNFLRRFRSIVDMCPAMQSIDLWLSEHLPKDKET